MSKAKLIRKSFPKIRLVSVKGLKLYQVDARRKGTSGTREHFKVKAEAEKRAQEIEDAFGKLGREGLSFPTELRVMALNCESQLKPFGKTLNDATQHYLSYLREQAEIEKSRPVSGLVDEWLHAKRSNPKKLLARDTGRTHR